MSLHLITDLVVRLSRTGAGSVVNRRRVDLSNKYNAEKNERLNFFVWRND
jgi:hypothetical protein